MGEAIFFCFAAIIIIAVIAAMMTFFTGFLAYKGTKAVVTKTTETIRDVGRSVKDEIPMVAGISQESKKWLKESRYYANLIIESEKQCSPSQQKRLSSTIETVNKLITSLIALEEHLRRIYSKHNLSKELKQTATELNDLQEQLRTADRKSAQILNDLVNRKQKHLSVLNDIRDLQGQIELKIRQNATVLNNTHAEITLLMGRGELDSNQFNRLTEELRENSDSVMDLLETMEEMESRSYS